MVGNGILNGGQWYPKWWAMVSQMVGNSTFIHAHTWAHTCTYVGTYIVSRIRRACYLLLLLCVCSHFFSTCNLLSCTNHAHIILLPPISLHRPTFPTSKAYCVQHSQQLSETEVGATRVRWHQLHHLLRDREPAVGLWGVAPDSTEFQKLICRQDAGTEHQLPL